MFITLTSLHTPALDNAPHSDAILMTYIRAHTPLLPSTTTPSAPAHDSAAGCAAYPLHHSTHNNKQTAFTIDCAAVNIPTGRVLYRAGVVPGGCCTGRVMYCATVLAGRGWGKR